MLSLDQCIKCNNCMTACPVAAVTGLFPGPKVMGPQAQRFRQADQPVPDAAVDYCSGCRVCNEVCPTGVPIAEMNARARAQIVAERGMPLRNHIIARADLVGKLSSGPQAGLVNASLAIKPLRWVVEQVMQIHRDAPLPPASRTRFRHWFKARGVRPGRRQVVYFHGCSTEYYEPWVGQAAIAVLEHNGFNVIVPPQGCCGLPLLSNGDFPTAQARHMQNVQNLLPYARQGIPIVGTSTSCILTLKEEAPELLGLHSQDVRDVAAACYDIFEFLRMLADDGELDLNFQPLHRTLPYHPPCQLRAHHIGRPVLDLLAHIPGLHLIESHAACCGIAGTYGLKREKYQIGMDVGANLFTFIKHAGSDLALCDSETCRWQISHATGIVTRHPIEILANVLNPQTSSLQHL